MRWLLICCTLGATLTIVAGTARANDFLTVAQRCAPQVDPHPMAAIVSVESAYNPFAIGVVGGHLLRQPHTLEEALATVDMLTRQNYNFSLGLAQVNRHNLARFDETTRSIFDPCANLRAAAAILAECFARAARSVDDEQVALRRAISCFYSGNFSTGFSAGYVQRVVTQAGADVSTEIRPIPVVRDGDRADPKNADNPSPMNRFTRETGALAVAKSKAVHTRSRCAPGVVIVLECESDGLANGSIKIIH